MPDPDSDYELRPLHARFEQRYSGSYAWSGQQFGDGRWEVSVRKAAPGPLGDAVMDALLRSPAFAQASDRARAELAHRVRYANVKRHHAVVEQGVLWPYVGIVAGGIVQGVSMARSGREQAVYDVMVDELFGETPLIDGGHTALRHVALTEHTRVMLFPIEVVRSAMEREPHVMQAISGIAAQHFRALLERFSEHASQSAMGRIAAALLAYAVPGDGLCDALAPLGTITHADIAVSAGTVREIVGRALVALEARGAIQRFGGHIVRLNRASLESIANQEDGSD